MQRMGVVAGCLSWSQEVGTERSGSGTDDGRRSNCVLGPVYVRMPLWEPESYLSCPGIRAVDPDPHFSLLNPGPGGKNFQIKTEKMQV